MYVYPVIIFSVEIAKYLVDPLNKQVNLQVNIYSVVEDFNRLDFTMHLACIKKFSRIYWKLFKTFKKIV